jgi:ATP-dependent RNA helicase HelY
MRRRRLTEACHGLAPAARNASPYTDPVVVVSSFAEQLPFPLDAFQRAAIEGLEADQSVLVAAPTGSGKTVVAEFAIARALDAGRKCFYTTPLKALSNQKFADLVAVYGPQRVGLLTGDSTINGEAPIVVMTTEVLRNMLYERSDTLEGLASVVLDEVHYLQDPYRGAVWEEVLIHLPASIRVVCLSATISNAEEFGEWIQTLRGQTRVVIEEHRPIPLEHHYLIGRRLHPMHVEQAGVLLPNPYVVSLDQQELRVRSYQRRGSGRVQQARTPRPREGHRGVYAPRREEVVEVLAEQAMLPAIYFVFSRAGCDKSVRWLRDAGIRLTTHQEAAEIRDRAEIAAAWIDEADLAALGFYDFLDGLAAGIAAHHAGMLPAFKETVEELFEEGLVKVVFATETLSLGINMPAKTVVIEDLWKFQGERHELLTPGEYTQLAGRAGRRGIDPIGHAVVVFQRQVPFERVAGLAATRTYDLASSFRPSYNMTVNLVRNYPPEHAHKLLNSSFAQFLADRGAVALQRTRDRDRDALTGYRANMVCHVGDFDEYWGFVQRARSIRDEERRGRDSGRQQEVREAVAALRPGEVIHVPRAKRRGLAVVLSSRDGKPTVLSQDRTFFRITAKDFEEVPAVLTRVALPRSGSTRSARYRRDVAARLVSLRVKPPTISPRPPSDPQVEREAAALEARARNHPCHACAELAKHERWAERADKLEQQLTGVERRIRVRTETLGRQFDRVLGVLEDLGYVHGWSVTEKGERLAKIYGEGDLLVGEALAVGVFDGLSPAEAAAVTSSLVYEARERHPLTGRMPTERSVERYERLQRLWRTIRRTEDAHQVQLCRELEPGFGAPIFRWAEGATLDEVLVETEMAPGDFVRNCKQLVDLLRQIEEIAPGPTATLVAQARASVSRGVVAYTGVSLR